MKIGLLELIDYRSYERIALTLPAGVVIFEGPNGAGKTNLLEAIRLLSVLAPWRGRDAEAVRRDAGGPRPGYRVAGETSVGAIEVVWRAATAEGGAARKTARLDGKTCGRLLEAAGRLRTALFAPEDLGLVDGPGAERRRFLDILVAQTDPAGLEALVRWNRASRQRARALRDHREGRASVTAVRAWDEPVVAAAPAASAARAAAVERLRAPLDRRGRAIFGAPIDAEYLPGGPPRVLDDLSLAGGPARDEAAIRLEGRDLREMASQGERRAAASVLRLAEADAVAAPGDPPVVLVDDVTGELDPRRRAAFLEAAVLASGGQAIVAATDAAVVRAALPSATVIRVPEDLR